MADTQPAPSLDTKSGPESEVRAPAGSDPRANLARKFDRGVSLLAWGYNEESLIEDFLKRGTAILNATVEDWELVFIDDGSTDRTGDLADAFARWEPRVRVLHNDRNRNVGYSCKRAIQSATKEYLLWQTVDWCYDISQLRIFLELTRHFDVVQGIRPTPIRLFSYIPVLRSIYRVRSRSDDFRKAIVSLSNYYLITILFGVRFHDFQNVTIYPSKLIQSVALNTNSSFLNPECLLRTYEKGATYIEVPIKFIPRTEGQAKGAKLSAIARSVRDIFSAFVIWGYRFRWTQRINRGKRRIFRVAEPFHLDDKVLSLVIPLFKNFQ
jgi:glycosyltransferase involved in cell wall biosynthesis